MLVNPFDRRLSAGNTIRKISGLARSAKI